MFILSLRKHLAGALMLSLLIAGASCNNSAQQDKSDTKQADDGPVAGLPFIGKRQFETRPGIAGTGTPAWFVDIKKNGDVYFSYVLVGQGNEPDEEPIVLRDSVYAGKYKQYLRCFFPDIDFGVRFYEITADHVYEVDKQHNRVKSDECCRITQHVSDSCACESGFFDTP